MWTNVVKKKKITMYLSRRKVLQGHGDSPCKQFKCLAIFFFIFSMNKRKNDFVITFQAMPMLTRLNLHMQTEPVKVTWTVIYYLFPLSKIKV